MFLIIKRMKNYLKYLSKTMLQKPQQKTKSKLTKTILFLFTYVGSKL